MSSVFEKVLILLSECSVVQTIKGGKKLPEFWSWGGVEGISPVVGGESTASVLRVLEFPSVIIDHHFFRNRMVVTIDSVY